MSKLGTPVVVMIGIVVVAIVIVAGVVANGALNDDDDDDQVALENSSITEEPQTPATQPQAAVIDDEDDATDIDTATTDPDDVPLSNGEINRVEAAALQIAGGGSVTDMDRSDDPGEAYEVEVLTDAGEVDVALDDKFERVPNTTYND